jgi:hypothetical protein
VMRRQIDEDGAIPMASPPRPLVHAHRLEGGRKRHWSSLHQPEKSGRTGRQLQASRVPGPRLPTKGQADRLERRHEPLSLAGIRGHEVRETFREDPAHTGSIAAYEFPDRQVEAARRRPPGEVGQVALIPAMDGRRGFRTTRPARRRRRRRELELHGCILNGDLGAAELTGG